MYRSDKVKFSVLFSLVSVFFVSASDVKFLFAVPFILLIPFFKEKLKNSVRSGAVRKIFEAFPLVYFVVALVSGINLFYMLSYLLIIILFIKQVLPCEEKDYYEIFLVGILLILLSSVSTISIGFGILLFLFIVSGTLMLVFAGVKSSHLQIPDDFYERVLAFSVISMIFSFVLFFSFPRLSLGYFHGINLSPQTESGFSTDVAIQKGEVNLNNRIVMRIEGEHLSVPLYISGLHYAYFNGKEWEKPKEEIKLFSYDGNNDFGLTSGMVKSTVFLEPTGTEVLFGPEKLMGIHGEFLYLRKDEFGDFFTNGEYYKTIRYDTFSSVEGKSSVLIRDVLKKNEVERYLQLPPLSEKFKAVAVKAAGNGKTDIEKARNIAEFLKQNYRYSLNPTASGIEDFVINKKTGYCEHFATAFVLLARVNNIPARLVSGFVTSEYNSDGDYFIVRAKDAHTWTQVHIKNKGWVRFDPTPPAAPPKLSSFAMLIDSIKMSWYRNVITYNSAKQMEILSNVRKGVSGVSGYVIGLLNGLKNVGKNAKTILIFMTFLALIAVLLKKEKSSVKSKALNAVLKLLGEDKLPGETLLEFAKRKGKLNEMEELIVLYYKIRFSKGMKSSDKLKREILKKMALLMKQ